MCSIWGDMTRQIFFSLDIFVCALMIFLRSVALAQKSSPERPFNNSFTAIFVFGDSTVDPGNNNFIGTPFTSNFPPYGRDFPSGQPTGRFTNGRLVTDFIASYVGIKEYVPPYLDPSLTMEELMTGVSFASAGSGFDPITPRIGGVISMPKQLEYFREYKRRLEAAIGKEKTNNLIMKSGFVVSAGTNDFAITYLGTPFRRKQYTTLSSYKEFLLQLIQQFTQDLVKEGARVIGLVGLPPVGCVPAVITISGDVFPPRNCVAELCSVATEYNNNFQMQLKAMQNGRGAMLFYADIYQPLNDMIRNSTKFGFSKTNVGCCGTGEIETSFLCNPKSHVCSDPSKYVFWDSFHPTETAYYYLFQALRPTLDDILKRSIDIISLQ